MLMNHTLEWMGAIVFALAIAHTFIASKFAQMAKRHGSNTVLHHFFHLIGEVETIFGVWSIVFLSCFLLIEGAWPVTNYLRSLSFTEPMFVLVIMTIAATKPIIQAASMALSVFAKLLPISVNHAFLLSALIAGALLGSFITEPAAMTLVAFILKKKYFDGNLSNRLKYSILAVLLVNISIGGALTPYAAPPVLMVAAKWGWTLSFMLKAFAWKVIVAVVVNACALVILFRQELSLVNQSLAEEEHKAPIALVGIHLAFLFLVVIFAHEMPKFMGIFLMFLIAVKLTKKFQTPLKIHGALLVAIFLSGLVILGGVQGWWLKELLATLSETELYLGAVALTAVTDNAALTYLGSQVPDLSDRFKYLLVAGAIAGGGLTIIANAPNPIAFTAFKYDFKEEGIKPFRLLAYALIPTFVAVLLLWI